MTQNQRYGSALFLAATMLTSPAFAQRTDDNAVSSAEDAFGKSVGDEQIGLYNPGLVRGFSPEAAGNLRIEGLYFDQRGSLTDRLLDGATMRVGISAQGYPFPAPTGIADYALRKPGQEFIASTAISYGPFGGRTFELDTQLPLSGDRLGMTAGIGFSKDGTTYGSLSEYMGYGGSLRYAPSKKFEIQPFWGRIDVRDEEAMPLLFTSGDFFPQRYKRTEFHGQKWAKNIGFVENYGLVSHANLDGFELDFGLFRSLNEFEKSHSDLMFDTDANGNVGQRIIVADRDDYSRSTSGEVRLSRAFVEGQRRHKLIASVRGRSLKRSYGGSALIDLGASYSGREDFRPEPIASFGPKTFDSVSQMNFGLGYELRWQKVGEFSAGIQKLDYSKRVETPGGILPETKDNGWLYSVNAAAYLSDTVALYGGYTRGLEESDVAPANAINRNEAPPAIRTEQKDFGVRWAINPKVSMVLGYFDVRKPYFNLDTASRFRELGAINHRGVELSVSGEIAPGLRVVAGTVYLDAEISGEEVDLGLIGSRPVGGFRLHTIANANWTLPWHKPLTLTARFERTSDRPANVQNTLFIPARWVGSLGARYRAEIGKVPVLARFNVDNILNTWGWAAGGSGFFINNGARRFLFSLAADI
ncbi:MAG: TonB-dependent receptor [Sphingomonadales bacterium]|jgi:iron complex outermembrane receptor protein|uniref:TonB-dependent receptor domain-containing protein n=1 Tax=Sphingorhabdus sp. TaxID=1902408 RepID=UPI003BAF6C96|nr:TonB-dependent receptor [Sphingomonadales bacterium]MBK9432059.1 TonB-dependent receptor [Sphingomonadales bacterium]